MHKFLSFWLTLLNRVGVKDPRYSMTVQYHDNAAEQSAYRERRDVTVYESHAAALAGIRAHLEGQKTYHLKEIAQIDYNLQHLDFLYPEPQDLVGLFRRDYLVLVANFKQLLTKQGRFEMHSLKVTNDYLQHANPELFVIQFPEYTAVVQTFSTELCALLKDAMIEAGFEPYEEWNGVGLRTWSVLARAKVATAA